MKIRPLALPFIAAIVGALVSSCTSVAPSAATGAAPAPLVPHVILIGVDGLSPLGIQQTETPHLASLVNRGAHTWRARGVMPTSSSPNWASMIMGAGPEQHGVTSNDWQPDKFEFPPSVKGPRGIFPTIYGALREQRPTSHIAIFHDWKDYARLTERDMIDLIVHPPNDGKTNVGAKLTMAAAVKHLREKKPTLLFVHLDNVDHAGHQPGWFTEPYLAEVRVADQLIGDLLAALRETGLEDRTVVIVTADHGGKNKGHGGNTMGELEIPWIIAGPGIKRGFTITDPVNTWDTAATLAKLLGVRPPAAWIARPVESAFEANAP